jgi:hypothetical protein
MNNHRPPSKAVRVDARPVARPARRGHTSNIHEEHTEIAPRIGGQDPSEEATSTIHQLCSDDVSLIDANDRGPAPSDSGFKVPPHERVFVAPPGAVEHGSFGDPRSTTDAPRLRTNATTDALSSAERPVRVRKWRLGGDGEAQDPAAAVATARQSRPRTSVVALPAAFDLHEVRGVLKDAERLLDSMDEALTSRDIAAARGELRQARHRLAAALALLAHT